MTLSLDEPHLLSQELAQVARRVHSAERVRDPQTVGKRRAVRYRCAVLEQEVFLHPQSALHSAAPEFVIYSQLVQSSKRPYMAGALQTRQDFTLIPIDRILALAATAYEVFRECSLYVLRPGLL